MLYQIKGIKYFDFFNDKNEHVHGIKFFCTTDTEDEDVLGCTVDTFYVAAKVNDLNSLSLIVQVMKNCCRLLILILIWSLTGKENQYLSLG